MPPQRHFYKKKNEEKNLFCLSLTRPRASPALFKYQTPLYAENPPSMGKTIPVIKPAARSLARKSVAPISLSLIHI